LFTASDDERMGYSPMAGLLKAIDMLERSVVGMVAVI
jgi:hypothetical protein